LQDSTLQAALGALGAHNLVVLSRAEAAAPWSWAAQGFTWDPSGLRFDLVRGGVPGTAAGAASRRTDILRSIPDGMALAGYARTALLKALWMPRVDSLPATRGPTFSLPFLPPELWGFAGDEIGIALAGVAPSALAPLPDLGLVLTLRDSAGAERMLRTVEAAVGAVRLQGRGYSFEEVAYGGRTFRSLVQPLSESLTPSWLVDGDLAILTTTRALMQQFVDTRRTGQRHALSDASFRRFDTFVPQAASMVFYGDPRRLHRALEQLGPGLGRWNADVARRVGEIEEFVALCGHFPAGAVWATRDGERLELRSWVVEPGR
jgi:hypothetical protein